MLSIFSCKIFGEIVSGMLLQLDKLIISETFASLRRQTQNNIKRKKTTCEEI